MYSVRVCQTGLWVSHSVTRMMLLISLLRVLAVTAVMPSSNHQTTAAEI